MSGQTGKSTVVGTNPYLELNNQGQILRLELKQPRHILGRDRTKADLFVPDNWQVISSYHAVLIKSGQDYQIYDGDGIKPSRNGLFLNYTRITPNTGYTLKDGVELHIGQNPNNQISLRYRNPTGSGVTTHLKARSLSLKNRSVLLGRDPNASLPLPSPNVSRRHATIDNDGQGRYILQDHSTNGVFVNGRRVSGSSVLSQGATIRIGPFTLVLRGDELLVQDTGNQIRLDADELIIQDKNKRRLDDISLAIEPGQFVALVGGSGAGKSTLMRSLLGIEALTQGVVYLNGDPLRDNYNIYCTQIGYVPQDDIIHRDLSVAEVLTYTARLRLPPDIEVEQLVQKTLEDVEMSHRRNALVSQLSGGQRKRVSIAVELLADPKLFFLDEPTSGLDPGLDKKMMQLLRQLADQGRTVILVTHATTNIKLCDRIVFLGDGGCLCYFGTPAESFQFFGVNNDFADIYNLLEKPEKVIEIANKFRQSNYYQRYVVNHLSPGTQILPPSGGKTRQTRVSFWQQLKILTRRYFQIQKRDRINLALALFTAPVGISLITLALKDKDTFLHPDTNPIRKNLASLVLFVFTSAALWVGLSSSLQEIIKETPIYLRERLVNLGLFAYLGSKVAILGGLAVLQSLLIVAVVLICFKSPELQSISWGWGIVITTFMTLLASNSLGLLVSSAVKTSSQANSALPLLLIPQIIFSGVLFKIEGIANTLSWLMISRWSAGAYGSLVNTNQDNLSLDWMILGLHTVAYLTATFWIQKRKDIF